MFFRFIYFVAAPFFKLLYRIKITGKENIPKGSSVVCANHTSMLDPIFLAIAFGISENWLFMGKAELFKIPGLNWLIRSLGAIPVNRGATDISTLRNAIDALKGGKKVMIFPEGTRVKDGDDAASVKTGAAMIASRGGATMMPVFISGNKKLFGKVKVVIGKPVSTDIEEKGQAKYRILSDAVFDEVMRLGSEGEASGGN